ncbi:hypothetical protein M1534_00455 [Patescibacteria group bacterium]|nr:hypothetical protein [Patescibacteria group bacterium]
MQIAIEELAQKNFGKFHLNISFKTDQLFTLEAFEGFNSSRINGIDGKKLKEVTITSILKHYWEKQNLNKKYFLAIPPDEDVDSIIVEADQDTNFSVQAGKYVPDKETTLYPFQIKELRKKSNIVDEAKKRLGIKIKEENLLQSSLFCDFKIFIKKTIEKRAYKGMALILFVRPPKDMTVNVIALAKEIKILNDNYFSKIWIIGSVQKQIDENGKLIEVPHQSNSGQSFDFYLKEVVNDTSEKYGIISIQCKFKDKYFSRKN